MRDKRTDPYTVGERSIILIGKMAGKTLDEVNALLKEDAKLNGGDYKPCPEGSWNTMKRYGEDVGSIEQETWQRMWDHITGPKQLSDLRVDNRSRAAWEAFRTHQEGPSPP